MLHGIALAVHRAWKLWRPRRKRVHGRLAAVGVRALSHAATLGVVLVGWILFRADSLGAAWEDLARILSWNSTGTLMPSPYILPAFLAVLGAHLMVDKDKDWVARLSSQPVATRVLSYASLLFVLVSFSATEAVPFIYAQF